MATTNSTSKSTLNISKKADWKNLYTDECTYVVTGNEKTKAFRGVLNDTYTLAKEDSKELNTTLLSYNDGIIRKGSELSDVSGINADKWYTIYGQPDKWIYDYEQKYGNCGVVSCLNVLSMAGIKDIQQETEDYKTWLTTGIEKTKSYTLNGEKVTKTTTTFPKPLFKYETEDLFTLWAIQNSKNDQRLYRQMYDFLNNDGYKDKTEEYWKELDKDSQSYCIHSNNYDEYKITNGKININEEDGGTLLFMQQNILNHYGLSNEKIDEDITVKNKIKTYSEGTNPDKHTGAKEDQGGGYYKSTDTITEITDNKSEYIKEYTITTNYYYKKTISIESQDGDGNPVVENKDVYILYSSVSNVSRTTTDYNNYSQTTEIERITKNIANDNYVNFTTEEEINNAEYNESKEVLVDMTEYKINSEIYSFAQNLANAVKDGKGVLLSGNAMALKYDTKKETDEYKAHTITLTGVLYGDVLCKTNNIEGKDRYVNDVIGFYVLDSGGWLPKTEKAQYVSIEKLYNFLTDYAEAKERRSGDYDLDDFEHIASDQTYSSERIQTLDCIRNWADDLNLVGTTKKNVLTGNSGNNKLYGGKGNDVLYGEDGKDRLYGQEDNDTLYGGRGNDYIDGGKGNDTVVIKADDIVSRNYEDNSDRKHIIYANGKKDNVDIIDSEYVDNNGIVKKIYESNDNLVIKPKTIPTVPQGYTEYNLVDFWNKREDQVDTVVLKEGKNNIQFENIDLSTLKFSSQNGDLIIDYSKTKDGIALASSLIVKNYFNNSTSSINKLIDVKDYYVAYDTTDDNDILWNKKIELEAHDFVKEYLEKEYITSVTPTDSNAKVTGSKYSDILIGGNFDDKLYGYSNNDQLWGGCGNDIIDAGDGNDWIYGSYGNDKIYGGKGENIIKYVEGDFTTLDGVGHTGGFGGHDFICNGKGKDYIELTSKTRDNLAFTRSGNNLVIYYNCTKVNNVVKPVTDDSITIQDYFKLKGKTSVQGIKLQATNNEFEYFDLVSEYNNIALIPPHTSGDTGTDGYDKLSGTTVNGGLGNDIITGTSGDNTITGGLGDDKMYGKGGNDTYIFETDHDGYDIIKPSSGGGTTTLKFNGLDFSNINVFTDEGILSGAFRYIKQGNDLIINYGSSAENSTSAIVRIVGFYKSKNEFYIKDKNGVPKNLKTEAWAYMKAPEEKASKIKGSKYNDDIIGSNKNDTISGGAGNDIITAGKGNDKITGGSGENTIVYNKGDGNDIITLTKGENLYIQMTGFDSVDDISYKVSGKNLVLYYDNGDDTTSFVTLKNFVSKDVTGANGSVILCLDDVFAGKYDPQDPTQKIIEDVEINLKDDNILPAYTGFSAKKYKYKGTYLSDTIDARGLSGTKKDKGAVIDGGKGNDIIYCSSYNDTIKGGLGNDTIYTGSGINKIDGGAGSDTYHIFANSGKSASENSIINDTGSDGNDTAIIYESLIKTTINNNEEIEVDNISVWFNTDGTKVYDFNILRRDNTGWEYGSAKLTGVENIKTDTMTTMTNDNNKEVYYRYDIGAAITAVHAFLEGHGKGYADINDIMTTNNGMKDLLFAEFSKGWTKVETNIPNVNP